MKTDERRCMNNENKSKYGESWMDNGKWIPSVRCGQACKPKWRKICLLYMVSCTTLNPVALPTAKFDEKIAMMILHPRYWCNTNKDESWWRMTENGNDDGENAIMTTRGQIRAKGAKMCVQKQNKIDIRRWCNEIKWNIRKTPCHGYSQVHWS